MAPACSPLARALWAVLPLASPGGELWGEVPASFWEGGEWYQCALLSPGSEGPPSPPDGGRGASSLPTDAPLLGAGCQSTPQHGAVCGGQLGFQGIQCLRSPSRSPWLGVCDSLKWSQQLLLCHGPHLIYFQQISCFPMSPPNPSPAMSCSPRRELWSEWEGSSCWSC